MKTLLEFDTKKNKFLPKKSILALKGKVGDVELGRADFDLSIYANMNKAAGDKLPLQGKEGSFIEIFIKAKPVESTGGQNGISTPKHTEIGFD
mmetsp:Transcript_18347/g.13347  ORF Transcript_18347/g.13347 Transcript_18347/m.13347 type:complete len:93 (+) Transcript_18347:133-411(+)|eukprot:CAMPEP_0202964598 /NCGR_PEP_ID=MMETSP1396-20130829/8678_1 /ASSEMBLY_ACC=CAM_ASM_000872 /TAXON_ID= /ORGANISM="Pseudokeronopsis sp., Strain Brazil" /LENGTH=92 /DNA_ID=CAMNT_0049686817 /DNA_START=177 /DNA_END=455 /DNA_ORIENTATION=-